MMPGSEGAISIIMGLTYLLAAALFILGLRRLGSPETARSGNMLGAAGMLIAVVVTLLDRQIVDFVWIIVGMVVGGAIGAVLARTIKMTDMPQMVALFNGFGGGASVLVASGEFIRLAGGTDAIGIESSVAIMLSLLIGTVTFSGGLVAFGKLQGLITERAVTFPLQKSLNLLLFHVRALGPQKLVRTRWEIQHVTLPQQNLAAVLVQDDPRVHARRHTEAYP